MHQHPVWGLEQSLHAPYWIQPSNHLDADWSHSEGGLLRSYPNQWGLDWEFTYKASQMKAEDSTHPVPGSPIQYCIVQIKNKVFKFYCVWFCLSFHFLGLCPVVFCTVGLCPGKFCTVGFCPVGYCLDTFADAFVNCCACRCIIHVDDDMPANITAIVSFTFICDLAILGISIRQLTYPLSSLVIMPPPWSHASVYMITGGLQGGRTFLLLKVCSNSIQNVITSLTRLEQPSSENINWLHCEIYWEK